MTSDNIRERVFRRMLAREAGPGADAPAIAAAARRLCEHFAERLTPLIGDAGVAAICARSLHLTERNVRGLASVRASPQGDTPFALLQLFLEQQEPAAATEKAVAVLATASELVASFIGERLTTSLLREAWPDDFAGNITEETAT
jgi:predicted kinase